MKIQKQIRIKIFEIILINSPIFILLANCCCSILFLIKFFFIDETVFCFGCFLFPTFLITSFAIVINGGSFSIFTVFGDNDAIFCLAVFVGFVFLVLKI